MAKACLPELEARVAGAYATRNALNHQVSPPYKKQMDRHSERAKRFEAACKKAKA